jgi:hypothetical protein
MGFNGIRPGCAAMKSEKGRIIAFRGALQFTHVERGSDRVVWHDVQITASTALTHCFSGESFLKSLLKSRGFFKITFGLIYERCIETCQKTKPSFG